MHLCYNYKKKSDFMIPIKKTKSKRIYEEDSTCIAFVKQVESLQKITKEPFIFFHIPNEISRANNPIFGNKLKNMGKLPGAPDYCFFWTNGCGFIEFKSKTGRLSEDQKKFKDNCEKINLSYQVARSVDDGLMILKNWGLLASIHF